MRISTICASALLFVIFGCSETSRRSTTNQPRSDDLVEGLIAFSPISGFWVSNGFAGEFSDLRFTRQTGQETGQITCRITGQGELWQGSGSVPFKVTGQSVGRKIDIVLQLPDQAVPGSGTVTTDNGGYPACVITFRHNGKDYSARLDVVGNKAAAKTNFLENL